jgi:hypothetical protein
MSARAGGGLKGFKSRPAWSVSSTRQATAHELSRRAQSNGRIQSVLSNGFMSMILCIPGDMAAQMVQKGICAAETSPMYS